MHHSADAMGAPATSCLTLPSRLGVRHPRFTIRCICGDCRGPSRADILVQDGACYGALRRAERYRVDRPDEIQHPARHLLCDLRSPPLRQCSRVGPRQPMAMPKSLNRLDPERQGKVLRQMELIPLARGPHAPRRRLRAGRVRLARGKCDNRQACSGAGGIATRSSTGSLVLEPTVISPTRTNGSDAAFRSPSTQPPGLTAPFGPAS